MPQPLCRLISIGSELLLGLTLDTNARHLAIQMRDMGWQVDGIRTVGDVHDDIVRVLREACETADAVLVTGGLGPTEDDRTRYAIAELLQTPLEERPELVKQIEERFKAFNRPMRPVNRVQALIPRNAEGIPNAHGTAPGIHARIGRARVFVMPGVPREMRAMFDLSVRPALADAVKTPGTLMRRLHVFGLGESTVGEQISDFMAPDANPLIGTTVQNGVITVRLLASGQTPEQALAALAPVESVIRTRLAEHLFGQDEDTLASVTVDALRKTGRTFAVAESCTGGLVAAALTDVPGASEVFHQGAVTYANEAKTRCLGVPEAMLADHGAVSGPVAVAMARGIREHAGADLGGAITGIAGPGGGTETKPVGTVWLALADKSCIFCTCQRFLADRAGNRTRAVNMLLDMARRHLAGVPQPWENCVER